MPPLYYPKQQRRNPFIDIAGLALQLQDVKQRGDIARVQQGIESKRLGLAERRADVELGTPEKPGTIERGVRIDEAAMGLAEQKQRLEQAKFEATQQAVKASDRPLDVGTIALIRNQLPNMDKQLGWKISKASSNWMAQAENVAATQGRRYDFYTWSRSNWNAGAKLNQGFINEIETAMKKEGLTDADKQNLIQMRQAVESPDFIDSLPFFAASSTRRKSEEELMSLETLKAQKAPGTQKAYITPQGTVEYLPGNQKPPAGYVPYSTGIDVEVGKEGGVSLRTGVSRTAGGMQRSTAGKLEEQIINTSEGIGRLNEVGMSFRPEYLQLGTKWQAFKTKWKEKLQGTPAEKIANLGVSENEQQLLDEFSAFRRDAIDNINRYIKEITGAQMSEKEAARLRKGVPDPGEGFFDGDSPTEFQAKWRSSMKALKLSQARAVYLRKLGTTEEAIATMAKQDSLMSLDQMKQVVMTRGKEIEADIRKSNPGIPEPDIEALVQEALESEFGRL